MLCPLEDNPLLVNKAIILTIKGKLLCSSKAGAVGVGNRRNAGWRPRQTNIQRPCHAWSEAQLWLTTTASFTFPSGLVALLLGGWIQQFYFVIFLSCCRSKSNLEGTRWWFNSPLKIRLERRNRHLKLRCGGIELWRFRYYYCHICNWAMLTSYPVIHDFSANWFFFLLLPLSQNIAIFRFVQTKPFKLWP
jgi:hypothetical protein